MVRAFAFQVCCPKRALNGKPVRSSEQSRRCPRNGNRPRSPGIAVRSNATVPRHGKASAMRVESPETGLSGFDWCCGGQHRQARLPVSRIPRLFLPSSKVLRSFEDLLPMKLSRLALAIALTPGLALAADESSSSAQLPPMVITRATNLKAPTPASVAVIDREQIEASASSDLLDVLRSQAGVQIRDIMGDGKRAAISLRGFGENAINNTLVLVDGRRLKQPALAGPDLTSVPLSNIERIEIIRGAGTVLYGDQAVGGVINIVTRTPDKREAYLEASRGS